MDREQNRKRVDLLKERFGVKRDIDLARFVGVSSTQVFAWSSRGMSVSYEKLFTKLIDDLSCCEKSRRAKDPFCSVCGAKLQQYTA